jgi:O-antigen/teichoic acid export membrane protein
MVGFFLVETEVGIYQISLLVAGLLTLPLGGFSQLFPSVASRLYSNGKTSELNAVYKRITRWSLTSAIPIGLMTLLYSEEILAIFGPNFPTGSSVLIFFTIAQLTNCAVGPSGFLLMITDHQYINMLNQWTLGVLNVALNYILILEFGLIGAALATATVLGFINIVRVIQVQYFEDMFPYTKSILKPILSGLITSVPMYTLTLFYDGYVLLVIGGVTGICCFALLLLIFGIEEDDREFFQENIVQHIQ